MEYSQKLKQIRVSKRFSQAEMAQEIGVSQQVYSYAEGGKSKKIDYKITLFVDNFVKDTKEKGESIAAIEKELPEILGDYEVRISILESFMEIAVPTMAEVKVKVKQLDSVQDKEVIAEIATLKEKIQVISSKKFHALQSKLF